MVNKAILVGHLGKTPELRQAGGRPFCILSIATSSKWTDRASGERMERTEWHRIEVWGGLAEQCAQFLATGRLVYVEGRLETDRWTDRATGHERQRVKVVASAVRFLGAKQQAGTLTESPPPERAPAGETATTSEAHQPGESIGDPDPVPPPDGDSFEALPMI